MATSSVAWMCLFGLVAVLGNAGRCGLMAWRRQQPFWTPDTVGELVMGFFVGGLWNLAPLPSAWDALAVHYQLLAVAAATYLAGDLISNLLPGQLAKLVPGMNAPRSAPPTGGATPGGDTMRCWILLAALALLVTGCATTAAAQVPLPDSGTLDSLKGHPLLQLGVADADATLAWVDQQVKAGALPEPKATLARACPTAVKFAASDLVQKVDALKGKLDAMAKGVTTPPPGPRLILHLTMLKYGPPLDPRAEVEQLRADIGLRLDALVTGCGHLVPVKQINELAGRAGRAGLISTVGPLAGFLPAP